MRTTKTFVVSVVIASLVGSIAAFPQAGAQEASSTQGAPVSVADLLERIRELQNQIVELQRQLNAARQAQKEAIFELQRSLREGLSGDDVSKLQEYLALDDDIYPEGLVTGFFGPLTRRAVLRFQARHGIEQAGVVGPLTRAKIKELIEEGKLPDGSAPPGLLVAPGIEKKGGVCAVPGIAKKLKLCDAVDETELREDTGDNAQLRVETEGVVTDAMWEVIDQISPLMKNLNPAVDLKVGREGTEIDSDISGAVTDEIKSLFENLVSLVENTSGDVEIRIRLVEKRGGEGEEEMDNEDQEEEVEVEGDNEDVGVSSEIATSTGSSTTATSTTD